MPATEYKDVRDNDWQALREQLRRFFQRLDKLEGHGGLSTRYAPLSMDGNLVSAGPNPQSTAALTDYITKGYLQSDEGAQFLYLLTKTLGKASTGTSKAAVSGDSIRIDNFSQRGPAGSSSGQYFIAMDRGYVAWVSDGSYWRYMFGTQRGTIIPDQRPTGLTTYDLGYRFHTTDTDIIYVWNGSTWVYDIPDASSVLRGLMSAAAQTIAGAKTFSNAPIVTPFNSAGIVKNSAAGLLSGGNTVVEGDLALTNITTANVSITKHGFAPIAPNDTAQFLRGDGSWSALPASTIQIASATSQFDKTNSSTLANVTGLTATLVAGSTYKFRAVLFVDADMVGGHKYAMAGTCAASAIVYQINAISNTANTIVISSRQTALAGAAGQAGATAGFTEIIGTITVAAGSGGTLTVQFAQNVATPATTSSVLVGSTLTVEKIG